MTPLRKPTDDLLRRQIKFSEAGNNIAKPMVLRQIQDGEYNVVAPSEFASAQAELAASVNAEP